MGPRPVFPATSRGPMLLLVAAKGRAKLFAPLRCLAPPRLRGVLSKISATLSHQQHYGHRKQIHQ